MSNIKIFPHSMGSKGAKLLAAALDTLRVRVHGKYRPRHGHVVVNWGSSEYPRWANHMEENGARMLNHPVAVAKSTNKLTAFQYLRAAGVPIPNFSMNRIGAGKMLEEGHTVYARTLLRGSEGRGIVIATTPEELVDAQLYVEGITGAREEYRVHVMDGKVIDFAKKLKKKDTEIIDGVRNHHNGWIYARKDINLSDLAEEVSIGACKAVGLDFGAVDIITKGDKVYVLEINTAPGLEGTTIERYATAIQQLAGV